MIEDEIFTIIKNACAIDEEITLESEIYLLSIDSLAFINVLVEIEKKFMIEFEFDELNIEELKTVKLLIKKVKEKLDEKHYNRDKAI